MDVSENSGFSPQIIHLNRFCHYKASILGYTPIFGNPHMTFCLPLKWAWSSRAPSLASSYTCSISSIRSTTVMVSEILNGWACHQQHSDARGSQAKLGLNEDILDRYPQNIWQSQWRNAAKQQHPKSPCL